MIRTLLSALRTLLGTSPSAPSAREVALAHPTVPDASTQSLLARLDAVEKAEALRAAEHAVMVDQLTRLYKRVATRIAREQEPHSDNGESVASLRARLGR